MTNNLKTEEPPFSAYPGLDRDYPYVEDYLKTGRLRDPKKGMFVARCPIYPKHPAPCHEPIWSHFGCLWPDALPPEQVGRFFTATERPWSDPEARNIVFGNVAGIYFAG